MITSATSTPTTRARLLGIAGLLSFLGVLAVPFWLSAGDLSHSTSPLVSVAAKLLLSLLLLSFARTAWRSPLAHWPLIAVSRGALLLLSSAFIAGVTHMADDVVVHNSPLQTQSLIGAALLLSCWAYCVWRLSRTEHLPYSWLMMGVAVVAVLLLISSVLTDRLLAPCPYFMAHCTPRQLRDRATLDKLRMIQTFACSQCWVLVLAPIRTTPAMYAAALERFLDDPMVAGLLIVSAETGAARPISLQPTFLESATPLPPAVREALTAALQEHGFVLDPAAADSAALTVGAVQWRARPQGRRFVIGPLVTLTISALRSDSYRAGSRDYQLIQVRGGWRANLVPYPARKTVI